LCWGGGGSAVLDVNEVFSPCALWKPNHTGVAEEEDD
jgi:hypothetical protein